MTLDEAMKEYKKKFGEYPPIFGYGDHDAIQRILDALKTGVPMQDPQVPPGAVI